MRLNLRVQTHRTVFTLRPDLSPVPVRDPHHRKMKLKSFRSTIIAVCFLVCSSLALDCDWDRSTNPNQDLDLTTLDAEVPHLEEFTAASDPEGCRAACCNKSDCDLALVGFPMDGGPHCRLVKCWVQDRDVCLLRPSTQFKVYRRKVKTEARGEAAEGGESPSIVPLQGASEPENNESNDLRCRLPMKVGPCRAAFPKFYYDVMNQSCRGFVYGGCKANENNFDSPEECEATCRGVTGSVLPDQSTPPQLQNSKAPRMAIAFDQDVSQDAELPVESEPAESVRTEMSAEDFAERCGAEPETGPCRAAFKRWYYNTETGSCQSFIYGGCRPNKNNYNTNESCMAACTVTVLPSSERAVADGDVSAEYKDLCVVAPDPGPCRAAFPKFFYDTNAGTCRSFIYGGCKGNKNRYNSMEECMKQCTGEGCIDTRNTSRNRWTAAVFLFVTLAAISALLLATLIIVTLRRRSLSRRASSISDKEELLPDPDEQSSVESLTVPECSKPDQA